MNPTVIIGSCAVLLALLFGIGLPWILAGENTPGITFRGKRIL